MADELEIFSGVKLCINVRSENPEEPHQEGKCVAHGKRFQSMSILSGGEKTIAALIVRYPLVPASPHPSSSWTRSTLTSLDNTNDDKVASYIEIQVSPRRWINLETLFDNFFDEYFYDTFFTKGLI